MNERKNIKAIVFDFGGTLDTNGIHWFEKFWDKYLENNVPITKSEFRDAYLYAEPRIKNMIKSNDDFYDTLFTQVNSQFEYLANANLINQGKREELVKLITSDCYYDVLTNIKDVAPLLEQTYPKFSLGLVSNYYGNIKHVLKNLAIDKYFSTIVDSSVVGISKPDKRIFTKALTNLNIRGEECIVVGDSYDRDIIPAKQNGCKTVLILKRSWYKPGDTSQADYKITSLKDLLDIEIIKRSLN